MIILNFRFLGPQEGRKVSKTDKMGIWLNVEQQENQNVEAKKNQLSFKYLENEKKSRIFRTTSNEQDRPVSQSVDLPINTRTA